MSVLVDENGQKYYKSIGYMTYEDKEQADRLDGYLKQQVSDIESRLREQGLIQLKGQNGSIELWYNLGLQLRDLWKKTQEIFHLPDTLLTLFLKAVYDNSNELKPAASRAERLRNSLFYYSFLLAGFPKETVKASGNWAEWSDFFDSKRIRDDPRIICWFVQRNVINLKNEKNLSRHDWFKLITRQIRDLLHHIDTTVLQDNELFQQLDVLLLK